MTVKALAFAVLVAGCVFAKPAENVKTAGKYEVTLRLPPDGLSAQEEMQIEFRVVDSTRVDALMGASPVVRAMARSVIDMPAMPGMASIEETAHTEGIPGEYGVHPTFPHGGEFRLTLDVSPPGGERFRVAFPLEVGDADAKKSKKQRVLPYFAELRSEPKNPRVGEPVELTLTVHSRAEPSKIVSDFDIQHDRKLHFIIVRSDLGEFSHEHPVLGPDGVFRLRYTFPTAGEYHLFADCAPRGAGGQVLLSKLKVSGKKPERFDLEAGKPTTTVRFDSLRIEIPEAAQPYPAGRTVRMHCQVFEADGKPVAHFETYLGALGHLILIHEDGTTFVHSHPDELDAALGEEGKLAFLARFPKAGRYRGWLQLQRGDKVATAPIIVQAGDRSAN